jgi:imidazole glycerol-phosphate synthase subunit HisH
VCDYGAGNTRSVLSSLRRLGVNASVTADAFELAEADVVILPGVGSARLAMQHLTATGASSALRERHAAERPIVGICLGMQLAMSSSEEDGGVATLDLVDGVTRRLSSERTPRLGWASVEPWGESYYFAHSYWCDTDKGVATSDGITAAVASGAFIGVQFHPEKSGPAGLRWLDECLSAV